MLAVIAGAVVLLPRCGSDTADEARWSPATFRVIDIELQLVSDPASPSADGDPSPAPCARVELNADALFDFGRAELRADQIPRLDAVLVGLPACLGDPSVRLLVEGHTDAVGDPEKNVTLSIGRAQAVVAHLVERGVDPVRVRVVGAGEEHLLAGHAPDAAEQRRVVVTLEEIG